MGEKLTFLPHTILIYKLNFRAFIQVHKLCHIFACLVLRYQFITAQEKQKSFADYFLHPDLLSFN